MASGSAYFRTVCCLNLPRQAALIAIARALHEVIRSGWNRIGMLGPSGTPGAGFSENLEYMPLALERMESLLREQDSVGSIFPRAFAMGAVGMTLPAQDGAYLRSSWYRDLERELDACWLLDAMIQKDGGRTMVGLIMTRPRSAKPFSEDDATRLDRLRPWIAHALRERHACASKGPNATEHSYAAAGLIKATAIVDVAGRIIYGSRGTNYLMYLCAGLTNDTIGLTAPRVRTAPSSVLAVIRRLRTAASEAWSAPPRATMTTPWGRLVIEASWMIPAEEDATEVARDPRGSLISVNLELQEHAAAHAMRVIRSYGAPASQVRIGTMLALGRTKPEIAAELGLKISSVTDAAKKLYDRLDVHNTAQLSKLLWTVRRAVPGVRRPSGGDAPGVLSEGW
jgi:DNA-binding CsgD family transcriptional regulator